MEIVISSIYIGTINKLVKKERAVLTRKNAFIIDNLSLPYKEEALLLKIGSGYVDFDGVKTEKELKKLYGEVNTLGEFRDGCGILKDTVPFFDSEGDLYVDYDTLVKAKLPLKDKRKKVNFKTLKKIRNDMKM